MAATTAEKKAYMAVYRQDKKAEISANKQDWRLRNKDKTAGYQKDYRDKYPGKRLAKKRTWREKNYLADVLLVKRSAWRTKYNLLEDDISTMLIRQGNKCVGCASEILFFTCSVDHIAARAKGGTNDASNLQLLCVTCNIFKRDHSMADFISHAKRIAAAHSDIGGLL